MTINLYFLTVTFQLHNPKLEKLAYNQGIKDCKRGVNVCPYSKNNLKEYWLKGWSETKNLNKSSLLGLPLIPFY